MIKSHFFTLLLAMTMISGACGKGSKNSSNEETTIVDPVIDESYNSVYSTAYKWPNPRHIEVCVVNPEEVSQELFDDVKLWVQDDYKSKVNIDFYSWRRCEAEDKKKAIIRVYFNRVHDWENASPSVFAGGGLSRVGNSATPCAGCEGGTLKLDVGKSGRFPTNISESLITFTRKRTFATAIHEFGHAIGLLHEHERMDGGKCDQWSQKLTEGSSNVEFATPFDSNSIMNYCKPSSVVNLSEGDVEGIFALYPELVNAVPAPEPKDPEPTITPASEPSEAPLSYKSCKFNNETTIVHGKAIIYKGASYLCSNGSWVEIKGSSPVMKPYAESVQLKVIALSEIQSDSSGSQLRWKVKVEGDISKVSCVEFSTENSAAKSKSCASASGFEMSGISAFKGDSSHLWLTLEIQLKDGSTTKRFYGFAVE